MLAGYNNHFFHLSYLTRLWNGDRGLRVLFLSTIVRTVAVSLLSIFSAIYIIEAYLGVGYELKFGLVMVVLFYAVVFSFNVAFFMVAEKLSYKVGFKRVGFLSFLPYLMFVWLFSGIDVSFAKLWLSGALWGANIGLFWWAYHGLFIKYASHDHFGEKIGEVGLVSTFVAVVAPLVGAVIIDRFGFDYVFVLSSAAMALSSVILLFGPDARPEFGANLDEVWEAMREKPQQVLGYVGNAFEGVVYLISWPVVVYLLFGGVLRLGEVISLATLLAAVFALLVGRRVDKVGEDKVIAVGVPYVAISWVIRFFVNGLLAFVAVDTVWKLGQGMIGLPMNVRAYKKAVTGGMAKAVLFREWSFYVGYVIALGFLLVWFWLGGEPVGTFLVAAIFSLLPLFVVNDGK